MATDSKFILESQLRECYARVVWTHKTHEKCADILTSRDKHFKIAQIILSAVTTTGILAIILGDNKVVEILTGVISVILLCISSYLKSYDLGGLAQKHANAASAIWNIRESYLSLLTDIRAGDVDCEAIRQCRDSLQRDLGTIYKGSPRTISNAYKQATKALNKNDEMTFTDDEIDKFLPHELRKLS